MSGKRRGDLVLNDNELARVLFREVERTNIREVAEGCGIGKTTLHHLLYRYKEHPTLETIEKIARYLGLPNWRVIEMTGFDLQLNWRAGNEVE